MMFDFDVGKTVLIAYNILVHFQQRVNQNPEKGRHFSFSQQCPTLYVLHARSGPRTNITILKS